MSTQTVVFLNGDRLCLRPIELTDIDCMHRWINDPEGRKWLSIVTPLNLLREREYIEGKYKSGNDITLAIVLRDGDRHIGNVGLHRIDHMNRRAETGMLIGEEECRGKGYGPEAKELMLEYAFNTLNLEMVTSTVIGGNERSHGSLTKSGYTFEHKLRRRYFRDGAWQGESHYSITRDEWQAR